MKRLTYLFAVAALLAVLLVAQVPAFAQDFHFRDSIAVVPDSPDYVGSCTDVVPDSPDGDSIIAVLRTSYGDFSWGATSDCSSADMRKAGGTQENF